MLTLRDVPAFAGTVQVGLAGCAPPRAPPSARTDNWLYAYGELAGALALAGRLVRLGTAVVHGLTPRPEPLRASASANLAGAAELAVLRSTARPIVLLPRRAATTDVVASGVRSDASEAIPWYVARIRKVLQYTIQVAYVPWRFRDDISSTRHGPTGSRGFDGRGSSAARRHTLSTKLNEILREP